MKSLVVCMITALLLLAGCTHLPVGPLQQSKLLDPQGNVTLYVSNQSFAVNPVDIRVDIDGQTIVNGYYYVGTQHNWVGYTLSLAPGKHQIKALSSGGEASLTKEFEVIGKHWAVLVYCYYPPKHRLPTPRQFFFTIEDKPIGFQ